MQVAHAQRTHGLVHVAEVRVLEAMTQRPQSARPEPGEVPSEVASTQRHESAELLHGVGGLARELAPNPRCYGSYTHELVRPLVRLGRGFGVELALARGQLRLSVETMHRQRLTGSQRKALMSHSPRPTVPSVGVHSCCLMYSSTELDGLSANRSILGTSS
jgi:hypothetical protein